MKITKKIFIIGIILLFIGMSISSSTGINLDRHSSVKSLNGKTLYVGGSGPNNYTKIQDAIDDASKGDTVFVYNDSSPYYEHLEIWRSINLIGEDKNSTVIDGGNWGDYIVFIISADFVNINGFTIQNNSVLWESVGTQHIKYNENSLSKDNIFDPYGYGIRIEQSNCINITNNNIHSNDVGILVEASDKNNIEQNKFYKNRWDVVVTLSDKNNITQNTFLNSSNTQLYLYSSYSNAFNYNNLYKTSVTFSYQFIIPFYGYRRLRIIFHKNNWNYNYWREPRNNPKPIKGYISLFKWFNFDWHPVQEPYDIEV